MELASGDGAGVLVGVFDVFDARNQNFFHYELGPEETVAGAGDAKGHSLVELHIARGRYQADGDS